MSGSISVNKNIVDGNNKHNNRWLLVVNGIATLSSCLKVGGQKCHCKALKQLGPAVCFQQLRTVKNNILRKLARRGNLMHLDKRLKKNCHYYNHVILRSRNNLPTMGRMYICLPVLTILT